MVRFAALLCFVCTAAFSQQTPSLVQFLGLAPTQTAQIQQINTALDQFIANNQARSGVLYSQISVENAKAAPDPRILGQAYLELSSIDQAISANIASTQSAVTALLTPRQVQLIQQISDAIVQSSLVTDAGCAFLGDNPLISAPVFQGNAYATFLLGGTFTTTNAGSCSGPFPVSIRNYLSLTDREVAGILAIESGNNAFNFQENNRVADVQVELRDELAKPDLDPLALGVRYIELAEIAQEQKQADATARMNARALLDSSQQAKLQSLLDTSKLLPYQFSAINCRLLTAPPGAALYTFYTPAASSCQLN